MLGLWASICILGIEQGLCKSNQDFWALHSIRQPPSYILVVGLPVMRPYFWKSPPLGHMHSVPEPQLWLICTDANVWPFQVPRNNTLWCITSASQGSHGVITYRDPPLSSGWHLAVSSFHQELLNTEAVPGVHQSTLESREHQSHSDGALSTEIVWNSLG